MSEGKIDAAIKTLNNSWGEKKYGGSCPPPGKTHRYFFKLYALKDFLELKESASKQDLLLAIEEHILGKTELIGMYSIDK